jgi:GNAT superfamily N-acetyltransferase
LTAGQSQRQVIVVREAVSGELPAVGALVTEAYAEFEPYLTAPNWTTMTGNIAKVVEPGAPGELLVALVGDRLAGTVTYLPPGPKDYHRVPQEWAVVRVLGVAPAHRGQGVARALTEYCLRRAREDGAPAVGLHTAEMMAAARTLYEDVGFVHHEDFAHLDLRFCIYKMRL